MTIYVESEKLLKQAKQPLARTDLHDRAEIREAAKSTDNVSDRFGYMRQREANPLAAPVTVEKTKPQRLKGLEYRRELDGAVTIISDTLEITVRRK